MNNILLLWLGVDSALYGVFAADLNGDGKLKATIILNQITSSTHLD
ncbi:MAG: hypothetical protein MTP17_02810 [Candidatus Midichloria sp.]|nr:MAG: hypothetical protein MTP17_02810 [Candidatus Midichloria sp.]